MINKENCKIIQDLFPNYIEKLTSKETNIFIGKHLDECDECKSIYENMQKELTINMHNQKKEINFLKKIRRKIYLLFSIILLILISIVIIYTRKFYILSKISNKVNELKNINNYYASVASVENNNLHIVESYLSNGTLLTNLNIISENDNNKISMYKNISNNTAFVTSYPSKTVTFYNDINEIEFIKVGLLNYTSEFTDLSFFQLLLYTKNVRNITTSVCDGLECYLVDLYKGTQLWIEKETGLTLRAIVCEDTENTRIYEYKYELNTLDNIIQPDINGYEIYNK